MDASTVEERVSESLQTAAGEVEGWRQTLGQLRAKAAELKAQALALDEARRQAALAAMTGDPQAQAALKKATDAALKHTLEIQNADFAIAEAERRLKEAEANLERLRVIEARKRFRDLAARRKELDEKVDALLGELAAAMRELYGIDSEQGRVAQQAKLSFAWKLRSLLTDAISWRLGGYQPGNPRDGFVDIPAPPAYRGRLVELDPWAKPETVQVDGDA